MITIVIITAALSTLALVGLVWCCFMLRRNEKLRDYLLNMLDQTAEAATEDLLDFGVSWKWRYDVFDAVSQDEMLFKFWRSFDSFYPDKRFLDPDYRMPKESE